MERGLTDTERDEAKKKEERENGPCGIRLEMEVLV